MNGETEGLHFSEEFKLGPSYRNVYKTTLSKNTIIYQAKTDEVVSKIALEDVVGVKLSHRTKSSDSNVPTIHIYSYPLKKRKFGRSVRRCREEHVFSVESLENFSENKAVAEKWVKSIKWMLARCYDLSPVGEGYPRRQKYLVFVNPFGGQGSALKLFNKKVKPLLEEADVDYELKVTDVWCSHECRTFMQLMGKLLKHKVMPTDHAGHAREIAQSFDVVKLDCIVCCSGDGLIHEVVNGLMSRDDWQDAIKTPLGHIPCGSGNGLCATALHYSCEPFDITSSVFALLHGVPVPLDIVKVETAKSEMHYSFLGIACGIVADVDIESEKYRYMGDTRFTLMAMKKIMKHQSFTGKIWYLPAENGSHTDNNELFKPQDENLTKSHPPEDKTVAVSNVTLQEEPLENRIPRNGVNNVHLPSIQNPVTDSWKFIEGDFIGWSFITLSHIGKDIYAIPGAELGGGVIYGLYFTDETRRRDLLNVFGKIKTGDHLNINGVKMIKASAFRLEPYSTHSKVITIDGEQVEFGTIQAEVCKGLGRVRCRQVTVINQD